MEILKVNGREAPKVVCHFQLDNNLLEVRVSTWNEVIRHAGHIWVLYHDSWHMASLIEGNEEDIPIRPFSIVSFN